MDSPEDEAEAKEEQPDESALKPFQKLKWHLTQMQRGLEPSTEFVKEGQKRKEVYRTALATEFNIFRKNEEKRELEGRVEELKNGINEKVEYVKKCEADIHTVLVELKLIAPTDEDRERAE